VASGELAAGITDTDDANVALQEGKPIGVVFPDAKGMGTLIIPNCAVLISGAPHEENAKRFVDYLLRAETEQKLAESAAAQIPARLGMPTPENVASLDELKPMEVDYAALAELLEKLSRGYLKQWVEGNS